MNRHTTLALIVLALIVAVLGLTKTLDSATTGTLLSLLIGSIGGDIAGLRRKDTQEPKQPP